MAKKSETVYKQTIVIHGTNSAINNYLRELSQLYNQPFSESVMPQGKYLMQCNQQKKK